MKPPTTTPMLNPIDTDTPADKGSLTRDALAAQLCVHPRTIQRWEARGLPVLKITRRTVRYQAEDVRRFLSRSRIVVAEQA